MIPKEGKRLAEVEFPIGEVWLQAAREKSIRHGHASMLHLWWAKRPLASSRASLLCVGEGRKDRRDCDWLYVVPACDTTPRLQEPIRDPVRLDWREVRKAAHYYLSIDAMVRPMRVTEPDAPYKE